jgi:hypothetical protein
MQACTRCVGRTVASGTRFLAKGRYCYIRRQTHLQVKKRLLDRGMEISELVEELMDSWLADQSE